MSSHKEETHYWDYPDHSACNFWKGRWLQDEYEADGNEIGFLKWQETLGSEEKDTYLNPCLGCKTCKVILCKEKKRRPHKKVVKCRDSM